MTMDVLASEAKIRPQDLSKTRRSLNYAFVSKVRSDSTACTKKCVTATMVHIELSIEIPLIGWENWLTYVALFLIS